MEKGIQLDIVTPDSNVLSQKVDYVGAPGVEGEFGILPGHIAFLTALSVGVLYYRVGGKKYNAFISGGFAEVSDDKLTVLAESAELSENIDVNRAESAKKRAEERLRGHSEYVNEIRAHAALQRAVMRLHVAGLD